jgi:hypothetical protein
MAATYTIRATPEVELRALLALKLCREQPDLTAKAINARIAKQHGVGLSAQHWTVINRARREGALERVTVQQFDFSKHGRLARQGKSGKASGSMKRVRRSRSKVASLRYPQCLLIVTRNGKLTYHQCADPREARRLATAEIKAGARASDLMFYRAELLRLSVSLGDGA